MFQLKLWSEQQPREISLTHTRVGDLGNPTFALALGIDIDPREFSLNTTPQLSRHQEPIWGLLRS